MFFLLLSWLFVPAAHAVLGETADSIQADQIRLRGQRVQHLAWPMQVHEIRMGDGSSLREFVNAEGRVFAVAWRSRLKPDLKALLGQHFDGYANQWQPAAHVLAARRMQRTSLPDLVVQISGRQQAFAGVAYLPSQVPQGVDLGQLR
jgi:hypothetical protein